MATALYITILAPPMAASALVLGIAIGVMHWRGKRPGWLRGVRGYAIVFVAFAASTALLTRLMYPQFWN